MESSIVLAVLIIIILVSIWNAIYFYLKFTKATVNLDNAVANHSKLEILYDKLSSEHTKVKHQADKLSENLKVMGGVAEFEQIVRTVNNRPYYYKLNHVLGLCLTDHEIRQAKEKYNRLTK